MKFIRSLPLICARTRWPFSSSMANMALGNGSTTVPSTSMASFLATGGSRLLVRCWMGVGGPAVRLAAGRMGITSMPGQAPTHERRLYQVMGLSGKDSPAARIGGQDAWTILRDGDRVLPVGGQAAVGGDDVQPSSSIRVSPRPEREHGLDGQAQAGLEAPPRPAGAVVRHLRLLVHLGADAVAHVACARRRSRARSATSSTAAEMSPMWLPGWAAAMPASMASRGGGRRACARRRGTSPMTHVRALSPCQPSTIAPASMDTIWPAARRRLPGMPWTISLVDRDAQGVAVAAARAGHADERGHAAALADQRLGDVVQLEGGDARLEHLAEAVQDVGDEPAGDGHLLDLALALEGHPALEHGHLSGSAGPRRAAAPRSRRPPAPRRRPR